MSDREDVLRQAMALPAEDRAYVVTVLERSLASVVEGLTAEIPTDGISGEVLLAKLERRSAAYRAGTTSARPADDLLADLQARQARER